MQTQSTLNQGSVLIERGLKATVESFQQVKDRGGALADRVGEGYQTFERASRSIPRDVKAIRGLIASAETSLGALMSDREFLDDVLGLTKDIKRHPWKLLMRWEH